MSTLSAFRARWVFNRWQRARFVVFFLVLLTSLSSACMESPPPTPSTIVPAVGLAPQAHATITLPPSVMPSDVPLQPTISPWPEYPSPTPRISIKICSPLAEHTLAELPYIISAPYAPPPPGREERHHGVDFSYYRQGERSSILGEIVQSVFSGRVAAAIEDLFPYGNVIIIETRDNELPAGLSDYLQIATDESIYVLFAHMKARPLVDLGETVSACQPLGEVGKSGNAGVPHLHLEMRLGPSGRQFERMAYYIAEASRKERDNYVLWRTSGLFRHIDPMSVLSVP